MKHIQYVVLITLIGCVLACEDDSESRLITSATQIYFTPSGGSQTIEIESNTDWHIISDVNWLSVYPTKGSLNQNVRVTAAIKDNELEQESRLIVMTDDGRKVVNVSVKVEGSTVKLGKQLDICVDKKTFSGKAWDVDSLEITSNVTWEVLGPEWLEAWDGERWRPLLETRGVVRGSGNSTVLVRTANINKNEESKDDVVVVREYLTGEFSHTVNVSQVGRMQTSPTVLWKLEDGIVFDWHCGCDVDKIYYKVTDEKEKPSIDVMRSTYGVTEDTYINSATGLKPGSQFYIIASGADSNGNICKEVYTTYGRLPNETAPLANIITGLHVDGGKWRFCIDTNLLTGSYHVYVTDQSNSAFMYNDPILWHIAMINCNNKYWFQKGTGYKTSGWIFWNDLSGKTDEIHVIACAAAEEGGLFRHKVFRYDRYYDAEGRRLPDKPLLDRIPKSMVNDPSLR